MDEESRAPSGRLRIGVDARELLGSATGVGRYLGELLLRWTTRHDRDRRHFVLYSPESLPLQLPTQTVEQRIVNSFNRPHRGTWWEQVHLRRAVANDRPDVFFAPAFTAPLVAGTPIALTVHDIAFEAHPEWFRPRERLRRRWLTRRCAQRAAVVLTDSRFSQSEIVEHYELDRSRVRVIPPGVAPRHDARKQRRSGSDRLVLYVGSIFNRRRLPDLIAAFAVVSGHVPDARLAIVGDDRSWPPLPLPDVIGAHGVSERVTVNSYVSDSELAGLYARAWVFAFLSEYEGFGLTPLEALAADVPIVVLDTPVAREVYGRAAHYVQRGDVRGTADVLSRLLTDPGSAEPVMQHAASVLARYSWERCASATLEAIEAVARRQP